MKGKKTQTTKTLLVKTVCASLKVEAMRERGLLTCQEDRSMECDDYSRVFIGGRNYMRSRHRGVGDKAGEEFGKREEP